MAAATDQHYAADRGSAGEAGLTFAAIHAMLQLEEALFSIRIHVV